MTSAALCASVGVVHPRMPPQMIERIIEDRRSAQAHAARPATLFDHGGDRKSEEHQVQSDNVTLIGRGNSADYLTARIARDRPDILERMRERASMRRTSPRAPTRRRASR